MRCPKCGTWHSLLELLWKDEGRGRQYFCAKCDTWFYEDGKVVE